MLVRGLPPVSGSIATGSSHVVAMELMCLRLERHVGGQGGPLGLPRGGTASESPRRQPEPRAT